MATYHYIDIEKCEKATDAEAEAMGGGTFYKCPVNGKVAGVSVVYPGATSKTNWTSYISISLHYPGGADVSIATVASNATGVPDVANSFFVNKSQFFNITRRVEDVEDPEAPLTEEQKIRLYLVIEGTEGRCPC